jgi:DNA-binding transcriptional LysR family regulator
MAGGGEWLYGIGPAARPVAIAARLAVTTAEAAVDAAVAGLGVTRVLSYQVAADLRSGRLCRVLTAHEPALWPVHLVQPGQGSPPQKLRVFIDHAVPALRRALAEAAHTP